MQVSVNNEQRVIFIGSNTLIEMIGRVPSNGFPFTTTIIKEDKRYKFS
jgi:hypothetical protein